MKIKAVFFDLDGTLLPMEQKDFLKAYLGGLSKVLGTKGYEPDSVISAIWHSTADMVKNDGIKTNEEVFWNSFSSILGEDVRKEEPLLDEFYRTDFQEVKNACGFAPEAKEIISMLHDANITTVLATNPLFPAIATESRIRWAGLDPEDFAIYTTYEKSRYCKPNPEYYKSLLDKLDLKGEECVMVGNDVAEDMIAQDLGMQVFLLTDDLINKTNEDIPHYKNGSFFELKKYIEELINENN